MLETIRRSWSLLTGRQKLGLSILGSSRVLAHLLDILGITLIGITAAVLLGNLDSIPLLDRLPNILKTSPLALISATAAIFLGKTALGIFLARETGLFLARVEVHNSNLIAKSVFADGLQSSKGLSRPEIEWVVLRSTSVAFPGVLGNAMSFLADGSLAVSVFILMLVVDWQSTLAISAYFAIIFVLFHWFSSRKVQEAGADVSAGSVSVNQTVTDLVSAFREIWVLQRTNYFLDLLGQARARVSRSFAIWSYMQAIPRLLIESALILGALAFLGWETLRPEGQGNFTALGILLVGSLRIMSALLPLQRSFAEIRFLRAQAEGAQEVLEKYISAEPARIRNQVSKSQDSSLALTGGLRIEVCDISFAFDNDISSIDGEESLGQGNVIKEASFSLERGSYVALVGPSGAGKSTLVDLILGLYRPNSGRLLVEGVPPRDFFAGHPGIVGYVPQKPGLVAGTIMQNIALGVEPSEINEESVWAAIHASQLNDFVSSLPDGIHSNLGAQADSISGGQRQRLGLARALYTNPKFLVLDEATSALDAQTESSVTESLMALRGKVTILVVAHRLSTVQNVDTAHVLESGTIIASGPFSKLRKEVPLIKNYIELMSFNGEG